jgi:S-adenosylmethionine synthetase
VEYEDDVPVRIDAVVVSNQHGPEVEWKPSARNLDRSSNRLFRQKYLDAVPILYQSDRTFSWWAARRDRGLTGARSLGNLRGYGRHWGGAVSGKDRPKWTVLRMRKIMSRKNCCRRPCQALRVQIAYGIGVAIRIGQLHTFVRKGRGRKLAKRSQSVRPAPAPSSNTLDLRKPTTAILRHTATWQEDLGVAWERPIKPRRCLGGSINKLL